MTPTGFEYYAGNYRGQDFECLRFCKVGVPSDSRVGASPDVVLGQMDLLATEIERELGALDAAHQMPHAVIDPAMKLLNAVVVACRVQEMLFRIHPYVNGNGHMARFVVWSICGRYGYWPDRWPVEPRPDDPPYTQLIVAYRNGNKEPLEKYVVRCMTRA